MTSKIVNDIGRLAEWPEMFPVIEELSMHGLAIHRMVSGKYNVFYTIRNEEKVILVLRILYGTMNITSEPKKIYASYEDYEIKQRKKYTVHEDTPEYNAK